MRRLQIFASAVFVLVTLSMPSLADGEHFISPRQLDLYALLAPVPVSGSAQDDTDLAEVLAAQESRTPAEQAKARADAEGSVFRFADVMGTAFTKEKLPKTSALFAALGADANAAVSTVKDKWNRPRPCQRSRDVKPLVECPHTASYPSGHSTFAYLSAVILSEMVPEKRAEIFARAEEYAHNRVVVGVHYPSDVAEGRIAGTVTAYAVTASSRYRAQFEEAKAETRHALGY